MAVRLETTGVHFYCAAPEATRDVVDSLSDGERRYLVRIAHFPGGRKPATF